MVVSVLFPTQAPGEEMEKGRYKTGDVNLLMKKSWD